jgi:hypothetical protein
MVFIGNDLSGDHQQGDCHCLGREGKNNDSDTHFHERMALRIEPFHLAPDFNGY